MYLLTRTVSAYSFTTPLVLGLYKERHLAEVARREYIIATADHDPFATQAYFDIDLEQQVNIIDDTPEVALKWRTRIGYLLIGVNEGFGQTALDLVLLSAERERCEAHAETVVGESDAFPRYPLIIELRTNQLIDQAAQEIQIPESLLI